MNEVHILTIFITALVSGAIQSIITVAAVKTDIKWLKERQGAHEKHIDRLYETKVDKTAHAKG